MSIQDERYQAVFSHLQGEIAELKSSAHQLAEENNVLRAQVNLIFNYPFSNNSFFYFSL